MSKQKLWFLTFPVLLMLTVTLAAWMLRSSLTIANFTMIYILVVLILAIRNGTWTALAASLVGFLCINFFLVQPYYTFLVADPREVLDLVVFFIVSVLVGQLAARVRQQTETANHRAQEQEILYRLTRSFNQIAHREDVYVALFDVLKTDLAARQVVVLPHTTESIPNDTTTHYVLLEANKTVYGTLCAIFDDSSVEKLRLFSTCASQAAQALQRIELTEQARKSEQFEEADRLKTALLHAVSHDLRTPITIIKTSANNLCTLGERLPADKRMELSQTIEQEADELDGLIGNLLDMSRLRAGALTLNAQPNSLEEVAGDVAARAFQRTKRERILLDFPDELPLVSFDYGLILQALTNIVDNALRYEPEHRQIELRGKIEDGEARLMIINHGESLTEKDRKHIMEPFYHGQKGRTGLGLPIASGIIEVHRGRLWVEDTPGGGTTFIISLPLDKKS